MLERLNCLSVLKHVYTNNVLSECIGRIIELSSSFSGLMATRVVVLLCRRRLTQKNKSGIMDVNNCFQSLGEEIQRNGRIWPNSPFMNVERPKRICCHTTTLLVLYNFIYCFLLPFFLFYCFRNIICNVVTQTLESFSTSDGLLSPSVT